MFAEISLAPISRISSSVLMATSFTKPRLPTCTAATTSCDVNKSGMQSATITAKVTPGIPVIKASAVGASAVTLSIIAIRFP